MKTQTFKENRFIFQEGEPKSTESEKKGKKLDVDKTLEELGTLIEPDKEITEEELSTLSENEQKTINTIKWYTRGSYFWSAIFVGWVNTIKS